MGESLPWCLHSCPVRRSSFNYVWQGRPMLFPSSPRWTHIPCPSSHVRPLFHQVEADSCILFLYVLRRSLLFFALHILSQERSLFKCAFLEVLILSLRSLLRSCFLLNMPMTSRSWLPPRSSFARSFVSLWGSDFLLEVSSPLRSQCLLKGTLPSNSSSPRGTFHP